MPRLIMVAVANTASRAAIEVLVPYTKSPGGAAGTRRPCHARWILASRLPRLPVPVRASPASTSVGS
jgi:hypothetical protein